MFAMFTCGMLTPEAGAAESPKDSNWSVGALESVKRLVAMPIACFRS
jgi:hypothetical protein